MLFLSLRSPLRFGLENPATSAAVVASSRGSRSAGRMVSHGVALGRGAVHAHTQEKGGAQVARPLAGGEPRERRRTRWGAASQSARSLRRCRDARGSNKRHGRRPADDLGNWAPASFAAAPPAVGFSARRRGSSSHLWLLRPQWSAVTHIWPEDDLPLPPTGIGSAAFAKN